MNKDELHSQSPSRLDGMTYGIEHTLRKSTCVEIATIVNKVLQRKEPIYSATIFFQRFFSRRSFIKHDRIAIAIGCCIIAGKCTDFISPAKIKDYIPEYLNRTGHTPPYQEKTELWVNTKEKLIQAERYILYILEYDVLLDPPYKYLESIAKILQIDPSSPLYEGASRCITEALRTTLCIQYNSRKLALGCLYFSKEELIRVHKLFQYDHEIWNQLYTATTPTPQTSTTSTTTENNNNSHNNTFITIAEANDILDQLRESIQLTKKTVAGSIKQTLNSNPPSSSSSSVTNPSLLNTSSSSIGSTDRTATYNNTSSSSSMTIESTISSNTSGTVQETNNMEI